MKKHFDSTYVDFYDEYRTINFLPTIKLYNPPWEWRLSFAFLHWRIDIVHAK